MTKPQPVVLVTGATRGLGRETALQLAQAGDFILVGARNAAAAQDVVDAIRKRGGQAEALRIDMTDPTTFAAAAETIRQRWGRLDKLINNAGVMLDGEWHGNTAATVSQQTLRDTFEVNFFALVELTQHLLPLLKKSTAPNVVNVSSVMGSLTIHADATGPLSGYKPFAYNASKAAVNAFTVHLAEMLRPHNGIVNSAHPGWVRTELGGDAAPFDVAQGAKTIVDLALEPDRQHTGRFIHLNQTLPW